MKGEHLERWKYLAARVAEEQDPDTFDQLVLELLHELELKQKRLNAERTKRKDTTAN